MVCAKSEEDYQDLYAFYRCPLQEQWWSILMPIGIPSTTFFNAMKSQAENTNSKLKQLFEHFSSLEMFVKRFFAMIYAQRNEKTHAAVLMLQKPRVVTTGDEASRLYLKLLTTYAYNRAKEELGAAAVTTSVDALANANKFSATAQECTCAFRQAMRLPCRHIFTVRDNLNISKFEKDIRAGRWFLDVYVQSCGLAQNNEGDMNDLPQVSSRKDERVLSGHQKFKKAAAIASKLADLASDCSTSRFKERLKVLESTLQSWKDGAEVTVTMLTPSERRDSLLNACEPLPEPLPSTGAMVEDLPLQRMQPLRNTKMPYAPCTSSEVDIHSRCLLNIKSQAAGGKSSQDSTLPSDQNKHNCASGSVLQEEGASGDCVSQGPST